MLPLIKSVTNIGLHKILSSWAIQLIGQARFGLCTLPKIIDLFFSYDAYLLELKFKNITYFP